MTNVFLLSIVTTAIGVVCGFGVASWYWGWKMDREMREIGKMYDDATEYLEKAMTMFALANQHQALRRTAELINDVTPDKWRNK